MKIQLSKALLRPSRILLALAASSLFGGSLLAQFQVIGTPAVVPQSNSKAEFVDYDADGDMDLSTTGETSFGVYEVKIYDNNSTNYALAFTLPGVFSGASAWLDHDLDGDLDLLVTGRTSGPNQTYFYRNDGNAFTPIANTLPALTNSSISTGDFDNDGDVDLFLAGNDGTQNLSQLYSNDQGTFTLATSVFPGRNFAMSIAGDVDQDGDLDIILTGYDTGFTEISNIYLNDNGVFTVSGSALPGYAIASGALGDYDGDGDLDLAITGTTSNGSIGAIYQNNGTGAFTQIASPIDSTAYGSCKWGDIDNDGDLDLLVTGSTDAPAPSTGLFRNSGGVFTNTNAPFTDVDYGSGLFGDYDGDGKLDIFLIGGTSVPSVVATLYRNATPSVPANSSPQAPATMTFTAPADGDIRFTWTNGSDLITPAAGLSYELFLSTAPGLHDITSPASNPATGYHKVATFGGIQGNSWTWHGATCGNTYYARVQTIDGAYAGSTLSPEFSFKYPFDTQVTSADPTLTVVDAANTDSIRWFDCVENTILSNTGATFTASHNGSYAAIMYRYGCVDTTVCKPITLAAVEAPTTTTASVFPNPANDRITVRLAANATIESVSVYDMQGRALMVPTLSIVHNEATLDLSALPAGLYVLRTTLSGRDGFATAKFKKD